MAAREGLEGNEYFWGPKASFLELFARKKKKKKKIAAVTSEDLIQREDRK